MSRLIDASTRTNNNNNKVQATTRMSREQVKEVLMNCRANPKHIEDCAVCPLFDVHVNCVSRMADEALEVIEEDEDKMRTLNEFALDLLKAQRPRVMTIDEVKAAKGADLYLEISTREEDTPYITAATLDGVGSKGVSFYHSSFDFATYDRRLYGWRCWTSRPTDSVRETVKWNG